MKKNESLKKISFLSHSLGGLIARYAVAVLFSTQRTSDQLDESVDQVNSKSVGANPSRRGRIAGLEPINFVTLATPHLGVRGRNQVWDSMLVICIPF